MHHRVSIVIGLKYQDFLQGKGIYHRGFFSLNLQIVFLVFMKKNVAIVIEHEMQCNVPGIRTTAIPGTQRRISFAHRDNATLDGRRSQSSAEKVPVRVAGRKKRWHLEIQNTHSSTWYSYTRYQVPGYIGIFQRSFSKKLCGDGYSYLP